jgi:hypothetical protein
LALVAGLDKSLDLRAKASTSKGLVDGVDGPSVSRVAKVGVVPVDDVVLEACWDDNFRINRVHCDSAEGDPVDSAFVGRMTDVVLDLVIKILL